MPVTLRSETAVAGVPQPDADANAKKDEDVECAICLEVIKPSDEVKLICGHKLHGQCAVRHLQLDRRCPICRKQPRTRIEDADEEEEYERMVDASEEIVIMRLVKKVKTETMRTLLRDFSIPETDLRQSKSNLAELVSEQLHYETDDDEGEEDEEDEEGEEGDSDVEDGLMPA